MIQRKVHFDWKKKENTKAKKKKLVLGIKKYSSWAGSELRDKVLRISLTPKHNPKHL